MDKAKQTAEPEKKSGHKSHLGLWLLLGEAVCVVLTVGAVVLLLQRLLPDLLPVLKSGDEAAIEDYLRRTSSVMSILCIFLMSAVQVFSVFIPGLPIHIAAGVVMGLKRGFLVCFAGFLLANWVVFRVAHLLKRAIRELGQDYEAFRKLFEYLQNAKNPAFITMLANVLPFIPNGIVPYAAAQTSLGDLPFLAAVAAGSALQIFADCAVGSLILSGDYLVAVAIFAALILFAVVLYWKRDAVTRFMNRW